MLKARYIMIGGFLGAGKTTAIAQIAQHLRREGQRVGLIANDQSSGLVDTAMLRATGFPTEEITGGCFCCKFNSLMEAAERLAGDVQPDVFISEPVGSCTDLKATVTYPLRQMYGDRYAIAPFSVMVDPLRALRVLGLEDGNNFSDKVLYIYQKQLEEADIIVINKSDLINDERLRVLRETLEQRFGAVVISASARFDTGIAEWMQLIAEKTWEQSAAMEVDYDDYAEGEALLGWFNGAYRLNAPFEFDGNELIGQLGRDVGCAVAEAGGELAHLKMTMMPDTGNDVAVANVVREATKLEFSSRLVEPLSCGQLLVNLRAESDPERLQAIVSQAIEAACAERNIDLTTERVEAFRPGRPTPTYRIG